MGHICQIQLFLKVSQMLLTKMRQITLLKRIVMTVIWISLMQSTWWEWTVETHPLNIYFQASTSDTNIIIKSLQSIIIWGHMTLYITYQCTCLLYPITGCPFSRFWSLACMPAWSNKQARGMCSVFGKILGFQMLKMLCFLVSEAQTNVFC